VKTNPLKTLLTMTGLCMLAGLSNPAAAAYCRSPWGQCQTQAVKAGHDGRLWVHATAERHHGRPAYARMQVVEADDGRVVYGRWFQKETTENVRVRKGHKDNKYKCGVRAQRHGHERVTVSCRIR
jgi:hypothetical protein